jgi:hypothetical protein
MSGLLLAPVWLLRWTLRRLPRPVLARLDAWSHHEAQRRAARRRQRAMQRS